MYLFANGVRLGRVVHQAPPDGVPNPTDPTVRVFQELRDHLGSNSVVLDLASGELVERTTAYAYGAVESDYRPGRWGEFREEYRFTGKEEDVEVGLLREALLRAASAEVDIGGPLAVDPFTRAADHGGH